MKLFKQIILCFLCVSINARGMVPDNASVPYFWEVIPGYGVAASIVGGAAKMGGFVAKGLTNYALKPVVKTALNWSPYGASFFLGKYLTERYNAYDNCDRAKGNFFNTREIPIKSSKKEHGNTDLKKQSNNFGKTLLLMGASAVVPLLLTKYSGMIAGDNGSGDSLVAMLPGKHLIVPVKYLKALAWHAGLFYCGSYVSKDNAA